MDRSTHTPSRKSKPETGYRICLSRSWRAFIDAFSFPSLQQRQGSRIGIREIRDWTSLLDRACREQRYRAFAGDSARSCSSLARFGLQRLPIFLLRRCELVTRSAETSASSWESFRVDACISIRIVGRTSAPCGDLEANSLARVLFGQTGAC